MPNFEAKKGDFAKIWQKLCGGGGGGRGLHRPWFFVHGLRRSQSVAANVSANVFHFNVQKQDQCDLDLDLGLHRKRSESCTTSLAFYLVNLFV